MDDGVAVTAMEQSRAAVLAALDSLTVEEAERRPAAGDWNVHEIAYHLLDMERWYIAKLCEAVGRDQPDTLARFIAIWARLRDETIALARELPAARLDTAGLLGGVPDWTPRRLLDMIAAHDAEHAAQALAARGASASMDGGQGEEPAATAMTAGARTESAEAPSPIIMHIAERVAWEAARRSGAYRGDSLDREGFIHCSTPSQVLRVANAFYAGRQDLVLLSIDAARVQPELRYEGDGRGECFPHIYGPLNISAVRRAVDFPPGRDGRFTMPPPG